MTRQDWAKVRQIRSIVSTSTPSSMNSRKHEMDGNGMLLGWAQKIIIISKVHEDKKKLVSESEQVRLENTSGGDLIQLRAQSRTSLKIKSSFKFRLFRALFSQIPAFFNAADSSKPLGNFFPVFDNLTVNFVVLMSNSNFFSNNCLLPFHYSSPGRDCLRLLHNFPLGNRRQQ